MKAQTIHEAINVIQGLLDMQLDAMEQMGFERALDFAPKHRLLRDSAIQVKHELVLALHPLKVEVQ
jgi:hypothetical protein